MKRLPVDLRRPGAALPALAGRMSRRHMATKNALGEEPAQEWKQFSPEEEKNMRRQNLALGLALTSFVAGVYFFSTRAVHKDPEEPDLHSINTELLQEESKGGR